MQAAHVMSSQSTWTEYASPSRKKCACGCGGLTDDHHSDLAPRTPREAHDGAEHLIDRLVETAVVRAIVPDPVLRRSFLKVVGASTALAAIAEVFPLAASKAIAQQTARLEKTKLTVGFVPITCTVPILLAHAMGEYQKEGLDVTLTRTPGWAIVRDKLNSGEYDASHLVLAMPLTMTLGVGSVPLATFVSTVQNVNGNAITLHIKHKERRDPKSWSGFKFGIPHEHSMHAMLLRYYLAEHGLDADKDVELRVYAPPDSVANMAAGNLDGMLFAEPWGQRAVFEGVGFLHLLTRDIFPGHPCCTLAVTEKFIKENPNSYGAMFRAVVRATEFADKNRAQVAELLAGANYLNQPKTVLEQVLLGRYADGLGRIVTVEDRIGFQAFPYQSTAVWLLTQLRRWNIIQSDINYHELARTVFLSTEAAKRMREMGIMPPPQSVKHTILGKEFDPDKPDDYLKSFAIRRV
jgi:nitrate/nitrite transport system substrate-binding protein